MSKLLAYFDRYWLDLHRDQPIRLLLENEKKIVKK